MMSLFETIKRLWLEGNKTDKASDNEIESDAPVCDLPARIRELEYLLEEHCNWYILVENTMRNRPQGVEGDCSPLLDIPILSWIDNEGMELVEWIEYQQLQQVCADFKNCASETINHQWRGQFVAAVTLLRKKFAVCHQELYQAIENLLVKARKVQCEQMSADSEK